MFRRVRLLWKLLKGGDDMLAMLYALNIIETATDPNTNKKKRTYAGCPAILKPDVAEQLRIMGYEELITE